MKFYIAFLLIILGFSACDNGEPIAPAQLSQPQPEAGFFPVTDFIKGQIAEIRSVGINPVMTIIGDGKTDSSWVKTETMDSLFAPFLQPVIDSSSVSNLFTEKTFLDQTINAITFTYDPKTPLPDTFSLQRWDVYIDPQKNTVTRIFMVKKIKEKMQQLTWQADKWCKMVTISNGPKGSFVEKEIMIKWDL